MNTSDFNEVNYLKFNPDVAKAVEQGAFASGAEHYQIFGKDEGRSWTSVSARQSTIFSGINTKGFGLEIGPSHSPIAAKCEGFNVQILDHASANDLREKYEGHGVDLTRIEEVDFIWSGEPLTELIGQTECYDWIIASHVIEHTPDFVVFLDECRQLLKTNGVLALVVPDKRYCFDRLRSLSSTGDVLDAHQLKRKVHSPGKVFDYVANTISVGGQLAWNETAKNGIQALLHTKANAIEQYRLASSGSTYIDIHNWRFIPESFQLLLEDLQDLNLCKLGIQALSPTIGGEFFAHLSKSAKLQRSDRLSLLNAIASAS
jgi:predicted SAM-dependent methyltransferase